MKTVRVKGPCNPGTCVPKPPLTFRLNRPRNLCERFYNPDGAPFEVDLPWDSWVQSLLRDGTVEIVENKAPVAPVKTKKSEA